MHHVFVSYSRRDVERVRPVVNRLQQAGVPIWMDTSHIPVSVEWDQAITKAIAASTVVAAFVSPNWTSSGPCQSEVSRTVGLGKRIVEIELGPAADPETAADRLIDAYRAELPAERARTELLVRSTEWDARGRRSGGLAAPALVKRMTPGLGRDVPPVVDAHLTRSKRRNRRRRVAATLGTLLTVSLYVSVQQLPKVRDKEQAKIRRATHSLVEHFAGYDTTDLNVWAGLERAAKRVSPGSRSYTELGDLMSALAVTVPDGSRPVGSGVGIMADDAASAVAVTAKGAVVTMATGRRSGQDIARPAHMAVEPTGRYAVVSGAAAPVLISAGRRTTVPCPTGGHAAVAPDGSVAVLTGSALCLWRPGRGAARSVRSVPGVALTASSGSVFVGGRDGALTRVSTRSGAVVRFGRGTTGPIVSLAVSPDGRQVAVGRSNTGLIDLVSAADGRLEQRVLLRSAPGPLLYNADGRALAVTTNYTVSVVDVRAGRVQQELRGNFDPVTSVAWARDGAHLWALTTQHAVRWPWRRGTVLRDVGTDWVTDGRPRPGGGMIALTRDGRVLDIAASGTVTVHRTSARPVVQISVSTDGAQVAMPTGGHVVVHRLRDGHETTLTVPGCSVQSTVFARDGRHLVVACSEDGLALVDLAGGTVVARTSTPSGSMPYRLVADDAGDVFVAGFHGAVLEVSSDLRTVRTIRTGAETDCSTPRQALAVAANGGAVISVGDGGHVLGCAVLSRRTGSGWDSSVLVFDTTSARQARAAAVSPDGTVAAVGFADGSVATVLVPDVNPGWMWRETTGAVRGLAFAPDGSTMVVASRDGLIETLPACPDCGAPSTLVRLARTRVALARTWGLYR